MGKCSECASYGLYKMVIHGKPFSYFGDIPCQRCKNFRTLNDEFVPSGLETPMGFTEDIKS